MRAGTLSPIALEYVLGVNQIIFPTDHTGKTRVDPAILLFNAILNQVCLRNQIALTLDLRGLRSFCIVNDNAVIAPHVVGVGLLNVKKGIKPLRASLSQLNVGIELLGLEFGIIVNCLTFLRGRVV